MVMQAGWFAMRRPSITALVLALVLGGGSTVGAGVTAGAAGVALPPGRIPLAARPAGTNLDREVFGFFLPSERDHLLHEADFSVLSTIAFFGIQANAWGQLVTHVHGSNQPTSRWAAWRSPKMDRIINKAHAAGTRVVLTVTKFAWDSTAAYQSSINLLSHPKRRHSLAQQIAAEVVQRGVDGVNIDFEPIPFAVKDQFVTFVHELRRALDNRQRGLELTVAATGYISNYEAGGIVSAGGADAIYVMAYPYHGVWSTTTGNISPLTRPGYDLHDTIKTYEAAGAPASKLILGLPYYGYEWTTKTGTYGAAVVPNEPRGSILYHSAMDIAAAHGSLWNTTEQAPWSRWQSRDCATCPLLWRELYYDDVQSYGLKFDLINTRNLRGLGIWTLGFEGSRTELNTLIRDRFGS